METIEAERRWRTQRDRYRKEKKKISNSCVTGSGAHEVYKTKWSQYALIDGFLGGISNEPECIIGNDTMPSWSPDVSCTPDSYIMTEEPDVVEDYQVTEQSDGDFSSPLPMKRQLSEIMGERDGDFSSPLPQKKMTQSPVIKRKGHDREAINNALATFLKTSEMLQNQNKENDLIDHFCSGLNVCIRALPPKEQFLARKEIETIMFKYEEKQFE